MYQRTCPVNKGVCQPSLASFNTGALNALNTNTTSTYYNATAPVYVTRPCGMLRTGA